MNNEKFSLEARLGNGRNDTIFVKENGNKIGYIAIVFDEESKIHDGILVLEKYLEREDVFKIGKMIQDEFIGSDEEMFMETYFGISYGVVCDETPSNWEKMLKK